MPFLGFVESTQHYKIAEIPFRGFVESQVHNINGKDYTAENPING